MINGTRSRGPFYHWKLSPKMRRMIETQMAAQHQPCNIVTEREQEKCLRKGYNTISVSERLKD